MTTTKEKMTNNPLILLCAFRYVLGYRSYAVSEVSDAIIDQWHMLNDCSKNFIIEEIERAIAYNLAGDDRDVKAWRRILLLQKAEK